MTQDNNRDIYFSIVIPSFNEAENIRQCLESVMACAAGIGYEIIVVDNGSVDGTIEIVKSAGLKIIENAECGRRNIGVLRNTGARQAKGPILVFLDGDMVVPPDWLEKAKQYFDKGFIGALGFTENAPPSSGWVARTWNTRLYQTTNNAVTVDFLNGRNIFINRTIFEKIRGFDETLVTNEDKDMTMRVAKDGYPLLSIPETRLFHLGCEKNLWEFIQKEYWRQGSSLAAARRAGYSPRTLRAPIMSFWHIALFFVVPVSLVSGAKYLPFFLLLAWLAPSAAIAYSKLGPVTPMTFIVPFFFLTFLRWNVSGAALIKQLFRLSFRGNNSHTCKASSGT